MVTRLEYVWLDGYKPSHLRSKVRIVEGEAETKEDCPEWSFDGSSTEQAEGRYSDMVLKPVRIYNNPIEEGHIVFLFIMKYSCSKPHKYSLLKWVLYTV